MTEKSHNPLVSQLISELNHPLHKEINSLREIILGANTNLFENIKWNSPNYTFHDDDRITMRIQPLKQIQLVFHRGAKKLKQPKNKLIENDFGLLTWRENDRAIASFKSLTEIESKEANLIQIINQWLSVPELSEQNEK